MGDGGHYSVTSVKDHISDPFPLFDLFHDRPAPLARALFADKSHALATEPALLVWANKGLQEGDLLAMGTSESVVLNRASLWINQD
jgi:hypothetical protein